jgi:hypothetical protein
MGSGTDPKWDGEVVFGPRLQVEIVSIGTNFNPHIIPECQEVSLAVLHSSRGVAVL